MQEPLIVPRSSETALERGRALFESGRPYDALRAVELVRPTDPLRADADKLKAAIQRELLAFQTSPGGAEFTSPAARPSPPTGRRRKSMKCPKCGYLGFESGDRCRNCGYEFSLSVGNSDPLDQPLDLGPDESRPPLDLDRVIGAPDETQPDDLPLFSRDDERRSLRARCGPRAPLGVRRATPEVPRARARADKNSCA